MRSIRSGPVGAAVLALGAVAALGLAGVAAADREQVHLTVAGQAAARSAVIRRADLGSAAGWTGGLKKRPPQGGSLTCPGFAPKQSDLVLVGDAESDWKNGALQIQSEAQVLRTPAMVRLDWARTVLAPQLVGCLRTTMAKGLPANARVVSVRRRAFPAIATYARAYRIVTDVTTGNGTVEVMSDFVLVGRGRTELTLLTTAPLAAAPVVEPAELRLAALLLTRVRL